MVKDIIKFTSYVRSTELTQKRLTKLNDHVNDLISRKEALTQSQLRSLKSHAQEIETLKSEFKENLKKVLDSATDDELESRSLSDDQDMVNDLYAEISGKLEVMLYLGHDGNQNNSETNRRNDSMEPNSSVRLPKLELKPFSGEPQAWVSFINMFDTTIHDNSTLSKVAKFQYLIGCLTGEPLSLIQSLTISSANYMIAYELLRERYHSPRRLTTLHLNQILDLPNITASSIKSLRGFVNLFYEHTQALKALECDISSQPNALLSALVLRKMDSELRRKLEAYRSHKNTDEPASHTLPLIQNIIEFLNSECSQVEDADLHSPSCSQTKITTIPSFQARKQSTFIPKKVNPSPRNVSLVSSQSPEPKFKGFRNSKTVRPCFVCQEPTHKIYTCPIFKDKSPQERYKFVQMNQRCLSCLGSHHIKDCQSQSTCYICNKKHHSLLHFERAASEKPQKQEAPSLPEPSFPQALFLSNNAQTPERSTNTLVGLSTDYTLPKANSTVLLATTLLKLTSPSGNTHVFRALIDSGSQCDFLSERAAQLLQVHRVKSNMHINGIAQSLTQSRGLAHLNVETLRGDVVAKNQPMLILGKITYDLPLAPIAPALFEFVKSFTLADPSFHLPGPIDVLIGGSLFPFIFTGQKHYLGQGLPVLMNTVFGYTLMGNAPYENSLSRDDKASHPTTLLTVSDFDLHCAIHRFWQQEEPPMVSKKAEEEIRCDQHFSETHTRDSEGRYVVKLPFKASHPQMGESIVAAKQRLSAIERKFLTNPQFKRLYIEFMDDYLKSGHMELMDHSINLDEPHYFLPHHGVLKANSSTTKLRTVFDASCKTSNCISLNDILMTGPKLQTNITDILLIFRCFNIVFTCDIRQMYRQIKIHPDDHKYQLILWRDESNKPVDIYKLSTVTYGMNSSPYLAIRTLHQLADDEGADFPKAAAILRTQTYVDDVIVGSDNEESALELQGQLIALLRRGGFELRKWSSNSGVLLQNVPKEHLETPVFLEPSHQPQFSVLGIHWSPATDCFTYNLDLPQNSHTKRQVLSVIAQIYDPCGFLSPVTMWAKCFMQLIWSKGLDWDQELPTDLSKKWNHFILTTDYLKQINIPRPLKMSLSDNIQLHGFSDASESGYAAVVYFRCKLNDGTVIVRQIISKTRVAPLKRVTLPRLELCSTHLLAQLVNYCQSILSKNLYFSSIHLWSDSTVALTWLRTPSYKLKTYVANRVAQVQELVPVDCWHHVSSNHNPADCASRGILSSHLVDHPIWWDGPSWLKLPSSHWPTNNFVPVDLEDSEEMKVTPLTVMVTTPSLEWSILTRYSSYSRLQRVMAYILRFTFNARKNDQRRSGHLTIKELKSADMYIVWLVQSSSFSEDISRLKHQQTPSQRLLHLSPFIDANDILRVGGRLKSSPLPFDSRHPAILPKKHHIVDLIVDSYHQKHLHAGPQLTQALLCQTFWILCARSVIRSRIFKCIKCFKVKPRNSPPMMGDLPQPRVTPSRPFLSTGVDYAGPFTVKVHNLRSIRHVKVYLCVFVCLVTKASHLEVVTDLTAQAFIACLTRFTSRRGLCSDIYSDCGTNFVGANSILKKIIDTTLYSTDSRKKINDFAAPKGIKFHFNPPAAPHQGGLWESCVKSVKHHLRRTMGNTVLTLMEFTTLVTQIEAMLNSRPLTPLSSDPADLSALTPGHFLIGAPLATVPESDLLEVPNSRLKQWQLVQAFHQRIWKRWQLEYLNTLQQRSKWKKTSENLKIGDLVLIHCNTPPLTWPLARVTAIHPGADGVVRVVDLKTANGYCRRPALKIFCLPL